jgi:polyhydroxyalkanoate synthesis regulator phasin
MKTREEVEALKRNWLNDSCWDIYETEGFEEYREELKEFQANQEEKWKAQRYNQIYDFAQDLGIERLDNSDEPNLRLAKYLMWLKNRISKLENLECKDR